MNTPLLLPPAALRCHPATPCPIDLSLSVSAARLSGEQVQLRFEASGEVHRLRVPAMSSDPGPTDGLWQHTCFEAFAATGAASGATSGTGYQEFNFAPSGHWAHYRFKAERQREDAGRTAITPHITVTHSASVLTLTAQLPIQSSDSPSQWGLSAVIELDDGSLSYWALHHPRPQPDFHNSSGWTLAWPFTAA